MRRDGEYCRRPQDGSDCNRRPEFSLGSLVVEDESPNEYPEESAQQRGQPEAPLAYSADAAEGEQLVGSHREEREDARYQNPIDEDGI